MNEPLSLLLVEDSDLDVEAIARVITRSHPEVSMHRLSDGAQVVPWLLKAEPSPRVVLLDLNLIGTSGLEVLRAIREQQGLADLPVVVLTSSTNPRDVQQCYEAGATGYLFKSADFALLRSTLTAGLRYWLEASSPA